MKPLDKTLSARDAVAQLADGMTIGIGGWGPRRKPMALVREIVRSNLKDLTVVAYGGPDVGLLCAAGKVRKLVFGFVSLDVIPLEPHFRQAREQGALDVWELDEGLLQLGLRAAAARLPFLPTRVGLGTDLLKHAPHLRTVQSPYGGETLLAMPALELDAALLHVKPRTAWAIHASTVPILSSTHGSHARRRSASSAARGWSKRSRARPRSRAPQHLRTIARDRRGARTVRRASHFVRAGLRLGFAASEDVLRECGRSATNSRLPERCSRRRRTGLSATRRRPVPCSGVAVADSVMERK